MAGSGLVLCLAQRIAQTHQLPQTFVALCQMLFYPYTFVGFGTTVEICTEHLAADVCYLRID